MTDKTQNEPDIGSLVTEMNRGFLHILVLALLEKDMYGYSMVKHIETLGYKVEENTLYPFSAGSRRTAGLPRNGS